MTRQIVLVATCAAIQCGLAVLWVWLKFGLETGRFHATGGDTAATVQTMSAVIGGAMGVFGAITAVIWAVARRRSAR